MPKVTGPLFSLEARKALGKTLTFQRRPGGASVYGYKKPKVPLTIPQRLQRWDIASAVVYWQSLSDAAKAEWEAKAAGQGQSGYSYMVSHYIAENFDRPLWLPMQEGSGDTVYDRSGHDNNGAITGASWSLLASGLWVLSSDGDNDYVNCGSGVSLNLRNAFTVEMWVYAEELKAAGLIDRGPLGATNLSWSIRPLADRNITFRAFKDTAEFNATPSPTYSIETWFKLSMTYDGATIRSSKNGAPVGTVAVAAPLDGDPAYVVKLGCLAVGVWHFHGLIALPHIYNRALSVPEISNRFNQERHLFGV